MRRQATARAVSVPAVLVLAALASRPALASPYDFVPAPQTDLNRIYRIDRATGEVISCQYGLQEGTAGGLHPAGEPGFRGGASARLPGRARRASAAAERHAALMPSGSGGHLGAAAAGM
jgi:hypothetical protein